MPSIGDLAEPQVRGEAEYLAELFRADRFNGCLFWDSEWPGLLADRLTFDPWPW